MNDLIFRLRERARIRRLIPNRKSVQEGAPDRIAALLDEAADALESRPDFKAGWDRATYVIDRFGMANSGLRFEEQFEQHSQGQETPRL